MRKYFDIIIIAALIMLFYRTELNKRLIGTAISNQTETLQILDRAFNE